LKIANLFWSSLPIWLEGRLLKFWIEMGLGQNILAQVGSGNFFVACFGLGQPPPVLENLLKYSTHWVGSKIIGSVPYLMWVRGMPIGLGQGPSLALSHMYNIYSVTFQIKLILFFVLQRYTFSRKKYFWKKYFYWVNSQR